MEVYGMVVVVAVILKLRPLLPPKKMNSLLLTWVCLHASFNPSTNEELHISSQFSRAVLVPALQGRDLIARAKIGTGKTLAFRIPIIKRLTKDDGQRAFQRHSRRLPRVLFLAPTRELAKQVEKEIKEFAPYLSTVCVYGGVSYITQQNALSRGGDVVVGTPGRIIDPINGNSLKLGEVEYLVLDEADQMLAVGFEEDVEVILEKLPSKRQSMIFSATMPAWVKKLAKKYLDNPLTIDLEHMDLCGDLDGLTTLLYIER